MTSRAPIKSESSSTSRTCKPGWERKLPRTVTFGAASRGNSKSTRVAFKPFKGKKEQQVHALIDPTSSLSFVNSQYVKHQKLTTRSLHKPINLEFPDQSPDTDRQISEVLEVTLRHGEHLERMVLLVADLGDRQMVLGADWLAGHKPHVDFKTGDVTMKGCTYRACI